MSNDKEIESLHKQTGFDADAIGCFLSNYKQPHVCPIATGHWCKDYVKCATLENGRKE